MKPNPAKPILIAITVLCAHHAAGQSQLEQKTPAPAPVVVNGSRPVVGPDGDRIAFVSNRRGNDDVYIISSNGTVERALTSTPENESNVAWTYRGKIMFEISRDDLTGVYVIDADGKNQREMTKVPGRAVALAPDGRRLLYMSGPWTAPILNISLPNGTDPRPITDGSSVVWNARWSPNGKWIAFTGRRDPKAELAIFNMQSEGSVPQQLSDVPASEGGAQCPAWSPDGSQIAFQVNSRTNQGFAHVWILDIGGGAARKLAPHSEAYLDETPSWFPNGDRLSFQSNRTGRMEVWTMNVDGSAPQQVTGTSH